MLDTVVSPTDFNNAREFVDSLRNSLRSHLTRVADGPIDSQYRAIGEREISFPDEVAASALRRHNFRKSDDRDRNWGK